MNISNISNLTLTLGSLTITPLFWTFLLASFFSSFAIWQRLKEDYQEEVIFGNTLILAAAALIFSRLFFVLLNLNDFGFALANWLAFSVRENFSLAGAFIGAVGMIYWRLTRTSQNPWEFLDALVLPFFSFLLAGGGGAFLTDGNFWHLGYSVIGLAGLSSYPWFKKKYRSFNWYPSGKTGFLIAFYGLATFPFLVLLAFVKNGKLYLNDLILFPLALVCLGALYYRSERDPQKDFKNLFKGRFKKN